MRRLFVSLCLLICLTAGHAAAATPPKITVTPFLQLVQIGSEPSKDFSVAYTNDSAVPQQLALSVADFGSLDQTGGVAFVGSEFSQLLDKYTLSPWLKLSKTTVDLKPYQTTGIKATIVNDSKMGPGGHYAAIVATIVTTDGTGGNQVSLKPKVTSLVLATKTGGEKYDMKLTDIDHDGNLLDLPSQVQVAFRATGNVHVVPRGIIYIKDHGGKVIAKGAINEQSGYVLPDTSRTFTVPLTKVASPSLLGMRYHIQIDYRYDGLDRFAGKQTSLHFVNPWLIVVALPILAVTSFAYRRFRK
jgi:hypothetical protein